MPPSTPFAEALPGISGILVTPFDADDRLAPDRLRPVVDRAIGAGVHILTANGNTGEFYGLTTDEAVRMVHAAAEHVACGPQAGLGSACPASSARSGSAATATASPSPANGWAWTRPRRTAQARIAMSRPARSRRGQVTMGPSSTSDKPPSA